MEGHKSAHNRKGKSSVSFGPGAISFSLGNTPSWWQEDCSNFPQTRQLAGSLVQKKKKKKSPFIEQLLCDGHVTCSMPLYPHSNSADSYCSSCHTDGETEVQTASNTCQSSRGSFEQHQPDSTALSSPSYQCACPQSPASSGGPGTGFLERCSASVLPLSWLAQPKPEVSPPHQRCARENNR